MFLITDFGCAPVAKKQAFINFYNENEFAGLVSLGTNYNEINLDYSLDSKDGREIVFKNCADVAKTAELDIVDSDYKLLQLLRINCRAAEYYFKSKACSQSYWPQTLDREFVNNLPAIAIPDLGGDGLKNRKGKMIQVEPDLKVLAVKANSVEVYLSGDLAITYVILARGDFDQDGFEDMLLRLDWSITSSFGKGFDLVMLSKTSPSQLPIIVWRMHL